MRKSVIVLFLSAFIISSEVDAQSTPATPETKWQFSIADSASYTGKCRFEGLPFEFIEVTVQENKLHFVGGEYNGFLVPINDKKDTFDVNSQAVFTFIRNPENKITGLKVAYNGDTFEGKKEEKKM